MEKPFFSHHLPACVRRRLDNSSFHHHPGPSSSRHVWLHDDNVPSRGVLLHLHYHITNLVHLLLLSWSDYNHDHTLRLQHVVQALQCSSHRLCDGSRHHCKPRNEQRSQRCIYECEYGNQKFMRKSNPGVGIANGQPVGRTCNGVGPWRELVVAE